MGELLPQSLIEDSLLCCQVEDGVMVASIGCQSVREWQGTMIRPRLESALSRSEWKVALGLAGVTGISSAFIRDLMQLTDRAAAARGRLVLFGVAPEIASLFHVAGFDAKLLIAETREEAIDAIQSGATPHGKRAGFLGRLMGRKAA